MSETGGDTMTSAVQTDEMHRVPPQGRIQDLPNELLIEIANHLIDGEEDIRKPLRTRELWSLSMTSRQFHAIASRALYQVYDHKGSKTLRPFLRTLAERPELASYVTEVRMSEGYRLQSFQSTPPEKFGITKEMREQFVQDARSFDLYLTTDYIWPSGRPWHRRLEVGYEDAEFAMLLYRVRHLTHLRLTLGSTARDTFLPLQILRHPVKRADGSLASVFPKLISLQIHMSQSAFQLGDYSLVPALSLPSLRQLTGTGWVDESDLRHWPLTTPSLLIEVLELDCCKLSSKGLARLLTGCKALKSLRLLHDGYGKGEGFYDWQPPGAPLSRFEIALLRHKHSLEHFKIIRKKQSHEPSFPFADWPLAPLVAGFQQPKILRDFEKLISVEFPDMGFMKSFIDWLPPSIQLVNLGLNEREVKHCWQLVAPQDPARFPYLKTIR